MCIRNGSSLFSHRYSTSELKQTPPVSQLEVSRTALLQYDQVRTDKLCNKYQSAFGIKFGPYVAREALFEEEYWVNLIPISEHSHQWFWTLIELNYIARRQHG